MARLLKNIFNKHWRKNKVKKILHPDWRKSIEKVFTLEGEDYYRFTTESDQRFGRFMHASEMLTESSLKMTKGELIEHMTTLIDYLQQGKNIEAGSVAVAVKTKAQLVCEKNTMFRLASASYFTMSENIADYDIEYNNEKIKKFERWGLDDFFSKTPIREFFPLKNVSEKDIVSYLKESVRKGQLIGDILSQLKKTIRSPAK